MLSGRGMKMNKFDKFSYAEAKQFLVNSGARVIRRFTSPLGYEVTYSIDGKEWRESENGLDGAYWDYSLRKVEQ